MASENVSGGMLLLLFIEISSASAAKIASSISASSPPALCISSDGASEINISDDLLIRPTINHLIEFESRYHGVNLVPTFPCGSGALFKKAFLFVRNTFRKFNQVQPLAP